MGKADTEKKYENYMYKGTVSFKWERAFEILMLL